MSVHVSSAVYKAALGGGTRKAIALKLADCANTDGTRVYPALQTVADEVEVSHRTVQRTIKEFVAEGLLIVVKRGGKGPRNTTEYRFNMAALDALPRVKAIEDKDDITSCLGSGKDDTDARKDDTDAKKGDTTPPNPSLPIKEQDARERASADCISDLKSEGAAAWTEITPDDKEAWTKWVQFVVDRKGWAASRDFGRARCLRVATRLPKPNSPLPDIPKPPSHIIAGPAKAEARA